MHELSLCLQIHKVAERGAAGRPVQTVHLQVGQLRQVVPDSLRYCWTLVTEGTPLAGSVLDIDSIAVTATCADCDAVTRIANTLILVCDGCGSTALTITTGEEFMLTSLDLALPTETEAHSHG